MPVTNPSAIRFTTINATDQIIGITSGTLTTAAPTSGSSPKTASVPFAHTFGDSAYFQGIFSADGGTTWNDFGSMIPVISSGDPVFQTVGCDATCDTVNLNITASSYYNFVAGTGTAATVLYKVYLLSKNTMAVPIKPLATNQILQYYTAFNYQKIFLQGTSSLIVTSGTTGTSTPIAHSLGYVPKVRAFRLDSTAPTTVLPVSNGLISDPHIRIDTTTLTFYADESGSGGINLNTSIEWRLYLDG